MKVPDWVYFITLLFERVEPQHINKQQIIQASDECVMCGLCLPYCPTYNIAHVEAESPRGRIALVRALCEGNLEADKALQQHLNHCLSCMKCEQVCPANVDYEKIIDAGRAISQTQLSWAQKFQQSFVLFILSNNALRSIFKHLSSILRNLGVLNLFSKFRLFNLIAHNNAINFSSERTNTAANLKVVVIPSCCLLYTSPSPRDQRGARMPSSA